jgi:hypothetical protein
MPVAVFRESRLRKLFTLRNLTLHSRFEHDLYRTSMPFLAAQDLDFQLGQIIFDYLEHVSDGPNSTNGSEVSFLLRLGCLGQGEGAR